MTDTIQGYCFYTDGSAMPNPGTVGYAIHGYSYLPKECTYMPYKGYKLTASGYAESEGKKSDVLPTAVIEGVGTIAGQSTINYAELAGFYQALLYAQKRQAMRIHINTDSEYVKKGYTQYLDAWSTNNWSNRLGKPIANKELWQSIKTVKDQLNDTNTPVVVNHVYSHTGEPGNEQADKLAALARMQSELTGSNELKLLNFTPEQYWDTDIPVHPLICKPWMYFRGLAEGIIPGEYYLGNIGKDKDYLGKADPNGSYAIIQLLTPDTSLEAIRQLTINTFGSDETTYVVNLKNYLSGDRVEAIMKYQDIILVKQNPRRRDLFYIDQKTRPVQKDMASVTDDIEDISHVEVESQAEPIVREQVPIKLAARVYDCLTHLKMRLKDHLAGDETHTQSVDITDDFYLKETVQSKKKTTVKMSLHQAIKVGTAYVDIKVRHKDQPVKIRLNPGIDMPDRNCLKRLEGLKPKITLLTWSESESTIRYATAVECTGATSIWCGYYSNLIVLPQANS